MFVLMSLIHCLQRATALFFGMHQAISARQTGAASC